MTHSQPMSNSRTSAYTRAPASLPSSNSRSRNTVRTRMAAPMSRSRIRTASSGSKCAERLSIQTPATRYGNVVKLQEAPQVIATPTRRYTTSPAREIVMRHKRTIPRVCEQCGAGFLTAQDRPGRDKFCSPACGYAARTKPRIERTCEQCGVRFLAEQFQVNRTGARFCSHECAYASRQSTTAQILTDGSARIPMRSRDGAIRGYVTVDAADVAFVNQWRWHPDGHGYAIRNSVRFNGKRPVIFMHREILGLSREDDRAVDHINRDKQDNRRSNLRVIPKNGNPQNVGSLAGSTSRFRGVSRSRDKRRWVARVNAGGKDVYLGAFDSEEEAAEVARAARSRLLPYAVD